MDLALRDFVLKYPSLLSCLDVHGIERAALAFEIALKSARSDSCGGGFGENEKAENTRPQIPDEELFGIERAARGFEKLLAAARRDSHGHFYTPDGAACPHSTGGRKQKTNPHPPKEYKLPAGFKSISVKKVYERIGDGNSETVIASDGKMATFSQMGINHFKKKKPEEIKRRLQSLDVALDTVKTGLHFDSLIPNTTVPQTEFIKDYGGKFFFTARRLDTGEVYSWYSIEGWQYNKKLREMKQWQQKKRR